MDEFWGPRSPYKPGCWMCIDHPPEVRLGRSRLCIYCLNRWFPQRDVEWMWDWMERQAQVQVDRQARRSRKSEERQLTYVRDGPGLEFGRPE